MTSTTAPTPLLERIAEWARSIRTDALDPAVVAAAKCCLLDTLACALAARATVPARKVLEVVRACGGAPEATLIGSGERSSLPYAALVNGTLIRALDFNDFYWGPRLVGHPSDNLAVALAVAEHRGRSGADLVAAMVAGYELSCRMQDLMDPDGPWDYTCASGIASAAMAAMLMGLDVPRFAAALAHAGVHGHTLYSIRLPQISEAKATANARIAQEALFGTLLAEAGLTGPCVALEGPRGLHSILAAGCSMEDILPRSGDGPRLLDVALKVYPCIGTGQSAVAAAIELHRRLSGDSSRVASIDLHVGDTPIIHQQMAPGYRRPATHESADHSFYYLTAVALADGELSPRQFEHDRWNDPSTIAAMDRITMHPDHPRVAGSPYPACLAATLTDGSSITVDVPYPPGHPANRLALPDLLPKLRAALGAAAPDDRAEQIMRFVATLDQHTSVSALMGMLALPEVRREAYFTMLAGGESATPP